MIKLIGLFKIKRGMSRDDFVDYYENKHAPLVLRLMPQIAQYRRNYVLVDSIFRLGDTKGDGPLPFDVMTESWFADRAQYDRVVAIMSDPKNAAFIAEDEANFMDRTAMTMFLVEEKTSDLAV